MKDDSINRRSAVDAVLGVIPYDEYWLEQVNKAIEALPSADTVEVVRCKDCRYWQDNNGGKRHNYCKWRLDETPDEDDFCSLGDWKDGDGVETD